MVKKTKLRSRSFFSGCFGGEFSAFKSHNIVITREETHGFDLDDDSMLGKRGDNPGDLQLIQGRVEYHYIMEIILSSFTFSPPVQTT